MPCMTLLMTLDSAAHSYKSLIH